MEKSFRLHLSALALLLLLPLGLLAQHRSDGLDDVLQHIPMATVFALKAADYWADDAGWDHLDSRSTWLELTATAVASYVVAAGVSYSLKQMVGERRPDHSDHRSFPSGHATFAFAGATMLWHEWGHLSPWVTVGGYGLATLVSIDRVVRDRHYLHDVVAGAAIGFAATELTYYVRKHIIKNDNVALTFTGNTLDLAVRF
ncbi:MAG: phosphatase PAP2 family protein [Prevotella sp.]|nr:phosphatase PAP2 family protein [Prevotella sp.]